MAIVSIQSHVAYGKVGNRAATFALERLGHEVMTINTVQFSNHTGYGTFEGDIMPEGNIQKIFKGLRQLEVWPKIKAFLSGYLGSVAIGEVLLNEMHAMRAENPHVVFCVDPVIGDVGRGVFIKPELADFIRVHLVQAADWITPNHFELEFLVQEEVRTVQKLEALLRAHPLLQHKGVIVKSFLHKELQDDKIATYYWDGSSQQGVLLEAPYINFLKSPNGIGDLFAALFVGCCLKLGARAAFERAHAITHEILLATKNSNERELQIIANQHLI